MPTTLEAYDDHTLRPVCPQTPRPLVRATSRCRPRPRPPPIQPRAEAQAHGSDQEAPQGQAGSQAEREARARQDAPAEHDCGARDDWERDWDLQRQGVQSGGDQARDGGILLGRVQYLIVSSPLAVASSLAMAMWHYTDVTLANLLSMDVQVLVLLTPRGLSR